MSRLFEPVTLRGLTFPNRAWVAPMCQYSATGGMPDDWHLVHYGSLATGGFGLVVTEATAVVPEGRISPQDTGLWNDDQLAAWARVVAFAHDRGTLMGIQLAHAGRKASEFRPWAPESGSVPVSDGGWATVAPSAVAHDGLAAPRALEADEVAAVPEAFAAAAVRADRAGFDVVEVHAAHGYPLHQFLSPIANRRDDEYGGTLENRARLLIEVVDAVRAVWPAEKPLFVRVSATDWREDGLTVEDVALVAEELSRHGVDLVDVSTGGVAPATIPTGPGYQVPFARRIREVSGLPVSAVGLISEPLHAEEVVAGGAADVVMLGRAALRDPRWALRAAHELGVVAGTSRVPAESGVSWQPQYERAPWRSEMAMAQRG
ncbi:NADH:flavin oxidoreductase/NADH oxidase [Antribacter gilvus]|uniref:NADH:flavin oxidoreductase/NADH oxidase n=1 Tax=Antribacter gilvus TaxID=2304675 RepID=UPI000F76BB41|nr:NADH:flavin oxidoreductase/NADH oxidase [Antribacter gilvus]